MTTTKYTPTPEGLAYEAKMEAKRERFADRAERASSEAEGAAARSRGILDAIPMGQPVLVGHHSEKRHRRDLAKADSLMTKWKEANERAKHYERKAESYGAGGISSDDPDAIAKLEAERDQLAIEREMEKSANKQIRAMLKTFGKEHGISDAPKLADWNAMILKLADVTPAIMHGLARWAAAFPMCLPQFQNHKAAEIRRLEQRIEELKRRDARPARELHIDGLSVTEDKAANRVQLVFAAGKPKPEVIDALKSRGFRWSPSAGAWQRHISNGAWHAAGEVVDVFVGPMHGGSK